MSPKIRQLLTALVLLTPCLLPAAPVLAHGDKKPGPLLIEKQGSFYVGGELATIQYPCGTSVPPIPNYCDPGQIANNQMFVQYQIPAKLRRGAYPVVMVHGGSHTAHSFDTTPDGREGWRTLFLREGFPVYVVDLPGAARAGFNPSRVNEALIKNDATLIPAAGMRISTLQQIWSFYRFGPSYPTLNAGSQFPATALTQYLSQMVPNTDAFLGGPAATLRVDALADLLDKIGPAIVLTHSASGPNGFSLVPARTSLVKSLISVEPAGCAVPAANVPAFKKVASLIMFGDFTTGNAGCQATADAVAAAGGDAAMMLLPQVGIRGNSHMLLLEKNNQVVANWLIRWIDKHVLSKNGGKHDDDDDDGHGHGGHDHDDDRGNGRGDRDGRRS
jgi:hypothetical protein